MKAKTIILPTDFSDNSLHAIRYALSLFGPSSRYIIANAYHTPQAGASVLVSIMPMLEKESQKNLESLKTTLENEFGSEYRFETHSMSGHVIDCCEALVESKDADLIALGTRGAGKGRGFFLGSSAADVIRTSECTVLAIPPQAAMPDVKHIALASDYRKIADQGVLTTLQELLQESGARLSIVHIDDVAAMSDELKAKTRAKLEIQLPETAFELVEVVNNRVVDGLIDYIDENNPNLMVMVQHKYGFFEGLFHLSKTRQMAIHSTIPVLILQDH